MRPSLSRAFQRHQEHDLKHPSLTTEQNKLPSFVHRYYGLESREEILICSTLEFDPNINPGPSTGFYYRSVEMQLSLGLDCCFSYQRGFSWI
jgi:hypothetical protein